MGTPDTGTDITAAVCAAVRQAPGGQSEQALMRRLRADGVAPFTGAQPRDPLALFHRHFLLFHCLYRLQATLLEQGEWLRIHCLDIGIEPAATPAAGSGGALAAADPLRAYYLDLANLDAMDAATLEAMLSGFWRRLEGGERRRAALRVLELDDAASPARVKRRYRELAQRHHPDKGGDTATLQRLNEALLVLTGS